MIVFTGKGNAGSWQIRGVQLAKAMGEPCGQNLSHSLMLRADHTIIVKKPPRNELELSSSGSIIWDLVDFYPQPSGNRWPKKNLVDNVLKMAERLKVSYLIGATEQMREDIGGDFTLYHHHRPDIKLNPIHTELRSIGYEGSAKFLGKWGKLILQTCKERGLNFIVNPRNLADVDIVVAFRDFPNKGYASDNWKSNVKLSNAQGSGTPIICNREAGYMETGNGGELYADTPEEFLKALDVLTPQGERLARSEKLLEAAYTVDDAARDYKRFISGL